MVMEGHFMHVLASRVFLLTLYRLLALMSAPDSGFDDMNLERNAIILNTIKFKRLL